MSDNKREAFEAIKKVALNIPMEMYNLHRNNLMTSGNLKVLRDDSPADYRWKMDNPTSFDSQAMKIGRALHTLTLEGHQVYDAEYQLNADRPINDSTGKPYGVGTKAYNAWLDTIPDNKTVLTVEDHNKIIAMRDAVLKNEKMKLILEEGIAESTLRASYCGVDCQIRPDWITPVYGMMDLKKCADLKWFLRDAKWKWKYIHAAAFYRSITRMALNMEYEDLPFCLLAVEEKEPYKTAVFHLDPEMLDFCEKENALVLEKLPEYHKTGIWPTGYEGINYVDVL